MYKYIIPFIFFLFTACSKEDNRNGPVPRITTTYAPAKQLGLDTTVNLDDVGNYFSTFDSNTLVFKSGVTIYEYDLQENSIRNKITIPREGPNSIKQVTPFDAIAKVKDSYYLFRQFNSAIFEITSENQVIEHFVLSPDIPGLKTFWGANYSPTIVVDSVVITPLYNDSRIKLTKASAFALFNARTKNYQEVVSYPSLYDQAHWGDTPYIYLANIQYIPSVQKYYVSFPLSHDIYIYDQAFNKVGQKTISSRHLGKIQPLRPKKLDETTEVDYKEDRRYFSSLSFYLGAFYDQQKGRYIRVVKKVESGKDDRSIPKYYLIVCDDKLNVIGEFALGSEYDVLKSFNTMEYGLLLFNERAYINENIAVYDTFQVIE